MANQNAYGGHSIGVYNPAGVPEECENPLSESTLHVYSVQFCRIAGWNCRCILHFARLMGQLLPVIIKKMNAD